MNHLPSINFQGQAVGFFRKGTFDGKKSATPLEGIYLKPCQEWEELDDPTY